MGERKAAECREPFSQKEDRARKIMEESVVHWDGTRKAFPLKVAGEKD